MLSVDEIKQKQKELHKEVDEFHDAGYMYEELCDAYESIFPQMSKLVDECLTILKDKKCC